MKITFLLIGTSLSLIPNLSIAQCVATQDCTTLGYTENSCSGGHGVKCPFGNKWDCFNTDSEVCKKYGFTNSCSNTGQIGQGESCANLYKQCSCQDTYKYSCTGTGYAGGSGVSCNNQYTSCSCTSDYEWKEGSCQKKIINGAVGDLYYCNGAVVAVKAPNMTFYIAVNELEPMYWSPADSACENFIFCNNLRGSLPSTSQLKTMYKNKSSLNKILSNNNGDKLSSSYYWSSNSYYCDGSPDCYGSVSYKIVSMNSGSETFDDRNDARYRVRPVLNSW